MQGQRDHLLLLTAEPYANKSRFPHLLTWPVLAGRKRSGLQASPHEKAPENIPGALLRWRAIEAGIGELPAGGDGLGHAAARGAGVLLGLLLPAQRGGGTTGASPGAAAGARDGTVRVVPSRCGR